MDPIQGYVDLARDPALFAKRYRHPFLFKRSARVQEEQVSPQTDRVMAFQTEQLQLDAHGLFVDSGAFASGDWVWPVRKREGNPFPDRISVGRATNCDVVMRFAHVSKHHAHLIGEQGEWKVVDQGSANGTEVDGKRLIKGQASPLRFGQSLRIGALALTFLDAEGLCRAIRAAA